ncbi:double-strand break repair protein AddB [Asticcacaulis sp. DXS10W]|uniref:Double-strand break repair protein AddB n=1 Tax=Asticcacaulis currens TaxID=2984210 RepID=A0ABT5IA32_9CAUL|nr:double-strand break repair protein AddB [Asticcacaulis currens]MDC7693051.1 double-strand break repair protein AddB [Asticcacaulis currens]
MKSRDLFVTPAPRWYSIASGRPFLDDLARGLCEVLGEELPHALILTPTRRGARQMAHAFTDQCRAKALLLPQVRALGDLEEGEPPFDLEHLGLDLPPALSSTRRRFELAKLIKAHYESDVALNARTALELADSLAKFFDSLALEEVDASERLDRLVHDPDLLHEGLGALAEHWQVSARFLAIAVDLWPKRLAELDMMDPSQRLVTLIHRLGDQWEKTPPTHPVIVAGTTGTTPATARLMGLVSRFEQGAVVLPGLDLSLAEEVWEQVGDSHPQGAMKSLLDRHRVTRQDVRTWPASIEADRARHARRRVLNEALRPAEATKDWRTQIAALKAGSEDAIRDGLSGLTHIEGRNDEEVAAVIALLMREALERPGQTAALVTPDITLSRRVTARLSRWGLRPDSSAGDALVHSPVGRFLHSLLDLVLEPFDAVRLLSLLKHPLSRFAEKREINTLEIKGLRGAKPRDADEVLSRLTKAEAFEAAALWQDYIQTHTIWTAQKTDLSDYVRALTQWAEALGTHEGEALWSGAAGAAASALLADLITEGRDFRVEDDQVFVDILRRALRTCTVRTGGYTHPRLTVLGAIEARMFSADRLILAGLEEGVWPQAAEIDPFLSRPMRKALGLPSPERRTGLSAHDFVQGASQPEVWMVTRQRREGEPQVKSRWLWRLETLTTGAGEHLPTQPHWLDWARRMDGPLTLVPEALKPATRPQPAPPVEARPLQLPVTQVEMLERDPYAVYARYVLRLKPLDRPNEPFEALRRGTAIHAVAEAFAADDMPLGEAGIKAFCDLLEAQLRAENLSEAQLALQRPLFSLLAREYVAFETERRVGRPRLLIEQSGSLTIDLPRGAFTLTAKADRVEIHERGVDVIDFKTGQPPSPKAVIAGFYPQLTLTAAILKYGTFGGFEALHREKGLRELIYVRLGQDVVRPRVVFDKKNPLSADEMAERALKRLKTRLMQYEDPKQGYLSWRAPQYRLERGGDYDQLARLYEWHVLGDRDADPATEEGE